jgi:hypothetical protein
MTEPIAANGRQPNARYGGAQLSRPQPESLADVLERVLDKGIIIAGDIRVNLLDIELLTIKIRLLVVSVDKAMEMGIDWWTRDPMLSANANELVEENRRLRDRIDELESDGEEELESDREEELEPDHG